MIEGTTCAKCSGSGRVNLYAYRSGGKVEWLTIDQWSSKTGTCVTRTANAVVQCSCGLGARYKSFPVTPEDPARALARYEATYGAVADSRPALSTANEVA